MCGIAGVIGSSWEQAALLKARDAMTHRGPNDAGVAAISTRQGSRLGLAHRRLSILDLSAAGHQPMADRNTGNLIVFNGEIYNHLEIRQQLPPSEYFSTSDTETLLAAYAHWGRGFLEHLTGMFAFAIWDQSQQELLLARDRLGKKPLYYTAGLGNFAFASEIKALLASGFVSRHANPLGIESFLAFGAVQEPLTILRDVQILGSGELLRVDGEGLVIEKRAYWSLDTAFNRTDEKPGPERIRECFFQAVKDRLISDVPLGAFLSGGTDSSAVVAAMSATSSSRPKTFCLDFAEGQNREGRFAKIVADKFGTDHHNVVVEAGDLLARLDRAFAFMDQPTVDGINSYFVSEVARSSGVTVALSGQGGDELFAGYPSFRFLPRLLRMSAVPGWLSGGALKVLAAGAGSTPRLQKLTAFFASGERDIYSAYSHQRGIFWDSIRSDLLLEPSRIRGADWLRLAVPPERLATDTVNQVGQLEIVCYLRNTLLRDLDVFSMAHSLEVRTPILDHRLVELLAPIPGKLKVTREPNKGLLVAALGTDLPQEVLYRRKGVFSFPWEQWLRNGMRNEVEELLGSNHQVCENIGLNRQTVQAYWKRFLNHDAQVFWMQVWALNVLVRWASINRITI